MGCAGSISKVIRNEDNANNGKYQRPLRDRLLLQMSPSEDNEETTDQDTDVSANTFTVATARNKRFEHGMYFPGDTADIDSEIEKWRLKQLKKNTKTKTKTIEEFVFDDLKIDASDVQKQRTEHVNRVRTLRTSFSLLPNGGPGGATPSGEKGGEVMQFNDFVIPTHVDEVDNPEYLFYSEIKLPPGFVRIVKYHFRPWTGHSSRIKCMAVAPSEEEFASAAIEDSHLTMTSMTRHGEETGSFIGHTGPIINCVFSYDGRMLATSSRDDTVIIWKMSEKGSLCKNICELGHPTLPICMCLSNNGGILVTGGRDFICRVWDVDTKEIIGTYQEHTGVVVCVSMVPGQSQCISGGGDHILKMWNVCETPTTIRHFVGHDGVVISINITPDAEKVLSNDDRTVKLWSIESGACLLNVSVDDITRENHMKDYMTPMPLPKNFLKRCSLNSQKFGMSVNGIMGLSAVKACKVSCGKAVFTLSCLACGELAASYFLVACTNRVVYIVSMATGLEELRVEVRSPVFALAPGRKTKMIMGDIFGNCYMLELIPEGFRNNSLHSTLSDY